MMIEAAVRLSETSDDFNETTPRYNQYTIMAFTVHELTDASESGVGNFQRPGYILPAVECHPVRVKLKTIRIFVNRCTDLDSDVSFSNC
jgi:hypothetical protein